jgi:branched-chain amino acid transport system ATP-binding protein
MMLQVDGISCFYGSAAALRDFSLHLAAGEVLCLFGRNGAGKTTALKAIMGLVRCRSGRILLDNVDLARLPAFEVPRQGVAYVPQGRRLFSDMSVRENLEIGLMTRRRGAATLARVLTVFPLLGERLKQRAGSLSGGEQQMLAMARALCVEPRVLLLDEPTEGLMPSMIAAIRAAILGLRAEGVGIVLVEQRVDAVLPVADRVLFVETGQSREAVDAELLRRDSSLIDRYVGVAV